MANRMSGRQAGPLGKLPNGLGCLVLVTGALGCARSCFGGAAPSYPGELLSGQGLVQFRRAQAEWAHANPGILLGIGDGLRTGARSRATVRLDDLGVKRVDELTTLEILPPRTEQSRATLDLKVGAIYLFMRGRPREFEIRMPHAVGTTRGTDFHVRVEPNGRSVVTVFDGEVTLTNDLGQVLLETGDQGMVVAGQAPRKTAVIEAERVIQWWLYYPAVLALEDLGWSSDAPASWRASLEAYRRGDLPQALERRPADELPRTMEERIFLAALWMSAGQIDQADELLAPLPPSSTLIKSLGRMTAAVTFAPYTEDQRPESASEWLADSYLRQSRLDLPGALEAATRATELTPAFGFAWIRRAELEFSFGRVAHADRTLGRGLTLSPRHAQGWALFGFVQAAKSRWNAATEAFERAISFDPNLGNGWLGRGLCRLKKGNGREGRLDLQVAAALEPNRSLLHSYLGKAFANDGDFARAQHELDLAKRIDAEDPTPWLYRSLLERDAHRFNAAIAELERSAALNNNRQIYRSRLLLDQDQAVRGANLAMIYQSAGLTNVAVEQAARAVAHDYASDSAHRFLAGSYDALRDPTRFNLRYESAWFNELLLAHLLAIPDAEPLSQTISFQEYSGFFSADRIGFNTDTEWRSDDQARARASQFGAFGKTRYAFDLDFQTNEGTRPNNQLDRLEWYTRAQHHFTPTDSILFLAEYVDFSSGDNFQYYDPDQDYRPRYATRETHQPNAVVGYHHEWRPGAHTLLLAGRLENDQDTSDRAAQIPVIGRFPSGLSIPVGNVFMDVDYHQEFETYLAELNQIHETERHTLVAGARYQSGEFTTSDLLTPTPVAMPPQCFDQFGMPAPCFLDPAAQDQWREDFERGSAYAYYTVEPLSGFRATAGVAYDHVTYPRNYRHPPVSQGVESQEGWYPKAGLVWQAPAGITLRAAYARSLGGVSLDENYRLEPSQVAGFVQSFRTLISESVVGPVVAPEYEILGVAVDWRPAERTYVLVTANRRWAEVDRAIGVFDFNNATAPVVPSALEQELDYQETILGVNAHQLLGDRWSFGLSYEFWRSDLDLDYPSIPEQLPTAPQQWTRSDLHRAGVLGLFQHPSGWFAGANFNWFIQANSSQVATGLAGPRDVDLPDDQFGQLNLHAGFRFPRRIGDITAGILNVTDQDYHLNPLNSYPELPRERVFMIRTRFHF